MTCRNYIPGPSDEQIVKQVRWWLDKGKEAEIEIRYLRRVCHLAEKLLRRRTMLAISKEVIEKAEEFKGRADDAGVLARAILQAKSDL